MERRNRCCIATCKGERFDLAHKFPRSQEAAESWLQAIDNPNLRSLNLRKLNESYQVCARHFQISDYKHPQSRSLNKLAVPSLNLTNLSQLHLARDSTPRQTDDLPLDLNKFNQTHLPDASTPLKSKNQPENLENLGQTAPATDSIPCEVDIDSGFVKVKFDSSNDACDENAPTIEVKTDDENHDSSDKIEFIEIISDEMDLDSNQSDFVGKKISFKATDFATVLEIVHPKYDKPLNLNAFWLRCHCDCSECFDSETKRKKIDPMDIPKCIQPKDIRQDATTDIFLVEWEDGHCSTHDIENLFQIDDTKRKSFLEQLGFNSKTFSKPPQIDFFNLVSFDDRIEKVFKDLTLHGFICVQGISTQNSSMAKLVIARLFPHLQTIHFEPFNEIHSNICTNLTCANFDCGLKCFFATQTSEIILVDGLNVTEKLKETDLHAFKMLTCTPVPLRVRNNNIYHEKSEPIIELDNENRETIKIQLDTQRFGPLNMLPQDRIESFYHSLEQFMTIIRNNRNQIVLNLEPGTMIILDNWRVMHKMLRNVGVMQCYLDRNDYIGRSRYLGLL